MSTVYMSWWASRRPQLREDIIATLNVTGSLTLHAEFETASFSSLSPSSFHLHINLVEIEY